MARLRPTLLLAGLLIGPLLGGCSRRSIEGDHESEDEIAATEAELADDASESSTATSSGSAFGRVFTLPLDRSSIADLGKAVSTLKAKPSLAFAGFLPFKCGSLTSTGVDPSLHKASFHASFDQCDGPYELSKVSGGMTGVLEKGDDSLSLSLSSDEDLTINGQPLSFEAQATVSVDGDDPDTARRNSTWNARWSGPTRRGKLVTHTAIYSNSVDPQTRCADIAGVTRGVVEQKGLTTVTELYGVCPGKCVRSGSITATSLKTGRSIVVRFDGTNEALVAARGRTFKLPLRCDL